MADVRPGKSVGKTWAETAGTGGGSGAWGLRGGLGSAIAWIGTVLLLVVCPAITILLWFSITRLGGNLSELYEFARAGGVRGLGSIVPIPSAEAWRIITIFGIVQAALQLYAPGKEFLGPKSPKGNIPVYKANGLQAYTATLVLFFSGWRLGIFDPARVYDLFGEILVALSIFSLLLCAFLVYKGIYFPSTSDNGSNDSIVYDFFWGRELYPRLGKRFDIKTWTNCRMGMMSWAILPLCFAAKQIQQSPTGSVSNAMLVSAGLMEIYVFKFFLWESGYWKTMDIAHDRAGYYLCWGCLNWVPAVYTSPALFLAAHPHPYPLSLPAALAIFAIGSACIYINYDADRQRQVFRATEGKTKIWGKEPEYLVAKYTTGSGSQDSSLLLMSGWWGLSRHFHYVPEILAAVFWTLPAGSHPLVWFYVVFLTLLLTDRTFRDEKRCLSKYGGHWEQYCAAVPYRMIPYVF